HEPFPADPKILWIVALDLTEESYGNAVGIGNADFTTRRLVDKIDMKPTLINAITACAPGGAKVPPTYDTDREAIETALSCVGLTHEGRARAVRTKLLLVLGGFVALAALGYGGWAWSYAIHYVSTDDAYVEGTISPVSAKVAGHVAAVLIGDNQAVKQDDLLLRIDPRDYQAKVAQARAAVATAEANLR